MRNKLLFIGLSLEEQINLEIGLSKFDMTYSQAMNDFEFDSFDLICIDEKIFELYESQFYKSSKPCLVIGGPVSSREVGRLSRPMILSEWAEIIKSIIDPVRTPNVRKIEIGAIVRSKTTPSFGKGVIVTIIDHNEVMVKFPQNKFLDKNKPLRCHISQLQVLGKLEEIENTHGEKDEKN